MAQPILSIEQDQSKTCKVVANLLPCRVYHDGTVDPVEGYWKPTQADDGTRTSYLRGRKLQGKIVPLPHEYRGVVVERKADSEQQQPMSKDMDDDVQIIDEPEFEKGALQVTGEFDELVVWGHETLADASADPYVRSVEEWLQVADQIHSYPETKTTDQK